MPFGVVLALNMDVFRVLIPYVGAKLFGETTYLLWRSGVEMNSFLKGISRCGKACFSDKAIHIF